MPNLSRAEALNRIDMLCKAGKPLTLPGTYNEPGANKWKRDAKNVISDLFGSSSEQLQKFEKAINLKTSYDVFRAGTSIQRGLTVLESMRSEYRVGRVSVDSAYPTPVLPARPASVTPAGVKPTGVQPASASSIGKMAGVFIVHSYDEEMKGNVAECLEQLNLTPVVLYEPDKEKRAISEYMIMYHEVKFAVVLLSPDDFGFPKADTKLVRPRARQDVVLKLGFLSGVLGRDRVLALYRDAPDFELPSDYDGVIYEKYDSSISWKLALVRELRRQGFEVDANDLLG